MRILHITAQKPDSTGSGTYLAETVRAFDRMGFSQAVVCGVAEADQIDLPSGVLARAVRFDTPELPFHVVGMSDNMPYPATRYRDMTPAMVEAFKGAFDRAFDDVLAQFTPDLVICHHLYLVCAVMAHRAWSCPICGLSHSTDIRQMRKIPLERAYIREGVGRLDLIFALHQAQAEEIRQVYGVEPGRISVVGSGYNAGIFNMAARTDAWQDAGLDSARKPVELVYAGKIWGKKGVPNLISALDYLPCEPTSLALRLAGGYSSQDEYDRIVRQAQSCRYTVEFLGKLSQPQLARAYGRADVFVLPSFFEGLPLVVIEALACGCKAVVTDLPGIRPWINANLPDAPVFFVEPPRMRNTDEPEPADLPAFERRLADALAQAIKVPARTCDTTGLSWDALARRIVAASQR